MSSSQWSPAVQTSAKNSNLSLWCYDATLMHLISYISCHSIVILDHPAFRDAAVRCTQKIPKKHLASVRLKKPMHRRRSHGFRGAAWLFLALAAAVLDVFNVFDAPAFTNAVRTQIASLASNVGVDLKSRLGLRFNDADKDSALAAQLFDGLHGRSLDDYDGLPRRFDRDILLDFFSSLAKCCYIYFILFYHVHIVFILSYTFYWYHISCSFNSFSHIYIYILYIYLKWISLIIKLSVSRCHVVIVFLPFESLCKVEVRDPQRSPGDGRRFCKSFGQFGTIGTGRSRCPQSSAPVVPCYALLSLGWVQSLWRLDRLCLRGQTSLVPLLHTDRRSLKITEDHLVFRIENH